MPVYVYRCRKCAEEFEVKGSFNDSSEPACPRCQGKVKRILCPVPVIFKGSGFYVTDHPRGS